MFEQALTSNVQNGHAWLCMAVFVVVDEILNCTIADKKRTILSLTNRIALRFFQSKYWEIT